MRGLPDPTLMTGQENSIKNCSHKNEGLDEFVWVFKDIYFKVQPGGTRYIVI
jgi:hypothetical protein